MSWWVWMWSQKSKTYSIRLETALLDAFQCFVLSLFMRKPFTDNSGNTMILAPAVAASSHSTLILVMLCDTSVIERWHWIAATFTVVLCFLEGRMSWLSMKAGDLSPLLIVLPSFVVRCCGRRKKIRAAASFQVCCIFSEILFLRKRKAWLLGNRHPPWFWHASIVNPVATQKCKSLFLLTHHLWPISTLISQLRIKVFEINMNSEILVQKE